MRVGACLLAAALCLAACGGGGGSDGGSGSVPVPGPSFTIAQTEVTVTSDTSSSAPVFASIEVTVANATSTVYVGGSYTASGLWQVASSQTDATHTTLSLQFRDAPTLAPGTYNDTIYLQLCRDLDCVTRIGSTKTISTHYIVTGTAVPRPRVTVGTTAISEQTLSFVPAQQANIPLTFQNFDSVRALDRSTTTNNAIYSVMYNGPGGATGTMSVTFKPTLPIGTYHDVVTIELCNNDTNSCQETIDGSGVTVAITLTVSDTITGPNGYSVRFAQVSANGLAWDPQRQVIYAAIRDDAGQSPGSIATIDPLSGSVVATAALGNGPNRLAISSDGAYLYVGQDAIGAVSRLALPALTSDFSIALPVDPDPTITVRAGDIEVSPDNSHVIAVEVAKPLSYSPRCEALVLYEDAQVRASLPGHGNDAEPCADSIQWGATGSVLYADDMNAFPSNVYRIDVAAAAMTSSLMIAGMDFLYAGPIQYRDGLIYTYGGVIYDTVSGMVLGQLPTPVNVQLRGVFSPETHRVITVSDSESGLAGIRITAFDTTTYSEVAHIDFPHLYVQQNPDGTYRPEPGAWHAIRWGQDGYAIPLTDGRVLLIQGAFIAP